MQVTLTAVFLKQNWKSFLLDGLHFNRAGSQFCAKILGEILEPIAGLNMWFPQWRDVLNYDTTKPFPKN